jgi:hypothetical protein
MSFSVQHGASATDILRALAAKAKPLRPLGFALPLFQNAPSDPDTSEKRLCPSTTEDVAL